MPNTGGSTRKQTNETPRSSVSPKKTNQKSGGSNNNNKARKRKRHEIAQNSDDTELESELEECNLKDALSMERKLRKVAKTNALNNDEMKKLLQKFVKNDHVLALVTLKAEDELARERRESEQRAIIITDTPSVPKLTRAKARELNKTPAITLPALSETPQPEIVALIKDDLHSDEEDEEYTFRDEDFVSEDDASNAISDFDSNPCTPQTPQTQTELEDSPVKLTADGCFKIPLDKQNTTQENLRIATRTRSKLCLQQTTIEDIQSEFVPPDVDLNELHDVDANANDEDWMQFLNDFSKPLNNSLLGDDDDPINDPEYVAADKVPMDAEELRNVNISRKELTELVAELFEGLVNEGVSLESVDLDTPQKFLQNSSAIHSSPGKQLLTTTNTSICNSIDRLSQSEVSRQIDFDSMPNTEKQHQEICVSDATISSTNVTQQNYNFEPNIMSTPIVFSNHTLHTTAQNPVIPVASSNVSTAVENCGNITIPAANSAPELIAIPVPGHPNHFNLARVVPNKDALNLSELIDENLEIHDEENTNASSTTAHDFVSRYKLPYDNNFTWQYISIKRHVYSEYIDKFENLRNLKNVSSDAFKDDTQTNGFTTYQHDLLQQQLRIHVQTLTQTYIQIYSHPEFWKTAPQVRTMLNELQEKAKTNATFNAWNLNDAIKLIDKWEEDLASDTPENRAFMEFIHKEISFCGHNSRQVARFPPRIMELVLNSKVFMYPNYLPRIPFSPKHSKLHCFAPSEYFLIALGLQKHLKYTCVQRAKLVKKASPYARACRLIARDTIFGKNKRRIHDTIRRSLKVDYYNPIKYFFEHNRAPPVEQHLITFENNTVLPPIQRFNELPLAWQNYIKEKNKLAEPSKQTNEQIAIPRAETPQRPPTLNYLDIVREAVGENIQLPDNFIATEPVATDSATYVATDLTNSVHAKKRKQAEKIKRKFPSSVTINVNYVFGGAPNQANISDLINSSMNTQPTLTISPQQSFTSNNNTNIAYESVALNTSSPSGRQTTTAANIIAYNYDCNLQRLEPLVAEITEITEDPRPESTQVEEKLQASEEFNKKSKACCVYVRPRRRHWRQSHNHNKRFGTSYKRHRTALKYRQKLTIKKRCLQLLTTYRQNLQRQELHFKNSTLVLHYYKYFRALDLYTDLLSDLKMFCRNNNSNANNATSFQSSGSSSNKRFKTEDDIVGSGNTTRSSRKLSRQEENLRNMLLPDTAEDANRKDAIYAFNFYDKVEEIFKSDNRLADYEKFTNILNSFDAQRDRPANLYLKLESLFLPDYPELAQLFLTFLLPAEASEIGKFFEHFMATNEGTFINKLKDFFNNQPAQIRKIYSCLNELALDKNVTLKKVEEKILPLLKGNQFLIDWFTQLFPEAPVPERLLPPPENVNLKEVKGKQSGESIETVNDILNSPTIDQQPHCQLRYINGRIFYGSKMTLPAKLSFLANKYGNKNEEMNSLPIEMTMAANNSCLHGMREYGEQRLAAAATAAATTTTNLNNYQHNSDDGNDKSEDEFSKTLVIDTTVSGGGDEDSCSSIEVCDDATLRAHALRLNPHYYSNTCFTSTSIATTGTPNIGGNVHQSHHSNAKKHSLNFYDDVKLSPRKPNAASSTLLDNLPLLNTVQQNCSGAANTLSTREKRKSPTKKVKSPNSTITTTTSTSTNKSTKRTSAGGGSQPMVIIPRSEHAAGAITYAKKLKHLVESSDEQNIQDNGGSSQQPIVARIKQRRLIDLTTSPNDDDDHDHDDHAIQHNLVPKLENSDDMEFLPEHTPPPIDNYQHDFPRLQLEPDSSIEGSPAHATAPNNVDSDEDNKLDIVATLAATTSCEEQQQQKEQQVVSTLSVTATTTTSTTTVSTIITPTIKNSPKTLTESTPFTRDEDKIFLIEMKLGSRDRNDLLQRITDKLPNRTYSEIVARHQFLIDFLSKLQGK